MKLSKKMISITLVFVLAFGVFLLTRNHSTEAVMEGEMMPVFQLKDVDENEFDSSQLKGKVVILDFWATWCPPCRMEIPHFQALHEKYEDKGLAVVGVSLDSEGAYVVKPFMENNKVTYTMLLAGQQIANKFGGIRAIPTTFVVDRSGKIVKKYVGYREQSVFENDIKELL